MFLATHGVLRNPTAFVPPTFANNYSIELDGISDYVSSDSTYSELDGQSKATLSFWIKPPSTIVDLQIISATSRNSTASHHQFQITLSTSGLITFSKDAGNRFIRANSTPLNLNAWNHVMYCIDTSQGVGSQRGKVFINGVDSTSSTTVSSTF